MAITGTGTEQDPWIVHSYNELSEAFQQASLGYGVFIKLANDIDCNSYGVDFVWQNLSVLYGTRRVVFDLDNHTIKNVQIAINQPMFTFSHQNQCIVKNGKIRNVFMSGSQGFCKYTGELNTFAKLVNVSFSANATGVTGNPFYCGFDSCAIYIEGGATNWSTISMPSSVSTTAINTDFLLNNAIGSKLFADVDQNSVQSCRIRGKFTGNSTDLASGANVYNNCVFDLETNCRYPTASSTGSNTDVINSDKLPAHFAYSGLKAVNSQEIINGDSLRAKGFVVVNVSA